jgi:type II secretory pathway component GspD/PulD (secretin)
MKKNKGNKVKYVLATAMLVGSASYAQQEAVADQDLLNMLDSVNGTAESVQDVGVEEIEAIEVAGSNEVAVVEESEEVLDAMTVETLADADASTEGELISVRLNKVGLEDAISLFAELSGANIIVPELTDAAQISVNLKDVEWRPALQSILDTYNYELYQRVSGSNVYSVRRRPAGAPEPQVVETFKLNYATVPNVAILIRELLPEDAKISEFASRNMLVVKSSESSLSEVRAVLAAIDKVRQQVYIESKFMELTDDAQKDLGIDWSALTSYSLGTQGSPEYSYSSDTSKTTYKDADGTQYNDASGYDNSSTLGSTPVIEGLTPTTTELTSQVLTSVLDADEFRVVLSAMEQNKGVNIVSNPKIIVANEEQANISIIRKEPNLEQTREQQLNDQPATLIYNMDPEMPWFEYGIKLDVIPSVNTSSNITVKIAPSLTRKYADKIAGDNTYPIIDEKSINTVFNLASGQTAAIGGLTEITEGEEERKVPVLGSIPFIGRLFSWKQTVRGQDETVIFVTVGLANTEQLAEGSIDMPGDAELARRQVIRDKNKRILRDQSREYFEAAEQDKLDDMMKNIDQQEVEREAQHNKILEKEAAKQAKRDAKANS